MAINFGEFAVEGLCPTYEIRVWVEELVFLNKLVSSFEDHHISNLIPKKEVYGNVEGSVNGGIGIIQHRQSKELGWGRKSTFSIAQEKEHYEVLVGT